MKGLVILGTGAVVAIAALIATGSSQPAIAEGLKVPPAALVEKSPGHREVAVLAGGCFWGVEGVYEHVKGVSGRHLGLCRRRRRQGRLCQRLVGQDRQGRSGPHRLRPARRSAMPSSCASISRSSPTRPRSTARGRTSGPQYRTAIFPQSASQARVARAYIAQLSKSPRVQAADRDPDRGDRALQSRRSLSPGLHEQEPGPPLHIGPRPAQGRRAPPACSRATGGADRQMVRYRLP